MTFFHKIMVAEKNNFLQMHNTILQRVQTKGTNYDNWNESFEVYKKNS